MIKYRWSFLLLLLLLQNISDAQLVNIESRRMQTDSLRFVFRGSLMTNYSNNNGLSYLSIGSNIATQLKTQDLNKIFFLIGDYSLSRSKDQDFQNAWFLHLRYNHEITRLLRLEGFVQSQNNKILDVNSRNLVGAGIRLKLVSNNDLKLYFGNTYMYEIEKSDELGLNYKNHRHSSYISASILLGEKAVEIINTLYYQPLYNNFDDYRILEQVSMEAKVSESVKLVSYFNYFFDSITPQNRSQFSSSLSFGISLYL